jgi:putative nucleotidyltransferase with HDIG domain
MTTEHGWEGRPAWAAVVQVLIACVPVAMGVVAAIVFGHLVPRPRSLGPAAGWWIASFAVSTTVLFVFTRLARRLLPLATLLKMSMAFPDRTPSRFSVALRAGTIGNLKARLVELREQGIDDDTAPAAETILVLAAAMNAHDRNTRGHAERVRALTELLGDELGLAQEDQEKLRWSALLHDVGKVMVDPAILNKAGPLEDHEWAVIHQHPDEGARIAAPLRGWLGEWALAIEQHHEKFDGTGYPRKLAGTEISHAARIVAVADAFEVMTSPRAYKEAMSTTRAREELAAGAGTHFDPSIVRAFLNVSLGKVRWVMGPLTWVAQMPFVRAVSNAGSTGAAAAGGAAAVATGAALGLLPVAPVPATTAPPPAIVAAAPTTLPAPAPTAAPGTAPSTRPVVTTAPAGTVPIGPLTTLRATTTTRPNRPPEAHDDEAATQINPSKPVRVDVLANDSDPDGDLSSGTISIVGTPERGKANPSSDGTINYVPDNGATGGDFFVYEVCDSGGACDTASVTIDF